MEYKLLKVSWKILLIISCILILVSLIAIFTTKGFVSSDFQSFGQSWSELLKDNSQLAKYSLLLYREVAVMIVIINIYSIGIILTGYKRGEKWAWFVILAGTIIGFGFDMFLNIDIGNFTMVIVSIVLLVIALVALSLGAKDILKKASS